jgi:hypothetical protein
MMNRKLMLWAVLVLLASALSSTAIAQSGPPPAYTENGFNPHLLDSAKPKAERMKLFAHIIALANRGQVRAQDLAGTIYWQGAAITGSPVTVNLVQARKLLASAAVHGDVLAMAKMAELELGAGREPQAMVWAQLYALYLAPMLPARAGRSDSYAANLIKRILDAGGKLDKATRGNVATMVQRFDKSIRSGIDAIHSENRNGRTFLVQQAEGADSIKTSNLNGVAEYMVGFDADGKPISIWPLDAFPDSGLSAVLHHYLKNVVANSVAKGSGTRYLRVSITHNGARSLMLRTAH